MSRVKSCLSRHSCPLLHILVSFSILGSLSLFLAGTQVTVEIHREDTSPQLIKRLSLGKGTVPALNPGRGSAHPPFPSPELGSPGGCYSQDPTNPAWLVAGSQRLRGLDNKGEALLYQGVSKPSLARRLLPGGDRLIPPMGKLLKGMCCWTCP